MMKDLSERGCNLLVREKSYQMPLQKINAGLAKAII
jgi:hypothetical protein